MSEKAASQPEDEILMEVQGLILDPGSKGPVVVLRDEGGARLLPIWIGIFEANAIAIKMEQVSTPRPLTHDLLHSLIQSVGAEVSKVVISDLQESTFFARIHLEQSEGSILVDARPSDAIALALRAGAPIFVAKTVLEKAKVDASLAGLSDEERIKKVLEELSPEDMGKYTM